MNKPTLIITFLASMALPFLYSQPEKVVQQVIAQVEPTPIPRNIILTGKASYYSHAGCLGCSKGQVMGNGHKFDENAMTLAVSCTKIKNKSIKYNTLVRVTNTHNGKSQTATITDCGGFSKYGRVADLSKGLADLLEVKTDKTIIEIEKL